VAFFFGDGFDLYATTADAPLNYWDGSSLNMANSALLSPGRFGNSRAWIMSASTQLNKTSGVNDAVHHFNVAFMQTSALSGSTLGLYVELFDGATAQCSIVFRVDGAILLQSGAPGGTTLATYTNGFTAINTWFGFEFEVVINNTTGSFSVRKNGNNVNDFTATGLNTRNSANNYANLIRFSSSAAGTHNADDFLWRSDASSVAWAGDVRCYTRMAASDVAVQFTRSGTIVPSTPYASSGSLSLNSSQGWYTPFTPIVSGTVGSVIIPISVASTANTKCTLYSSLTTGLPGTPLASATPVSSPGIGNAVFTFPSPPTVAAGTLYFIATNSDATSGQTGADTNRFNTYYRNSDTYASFPTTNPVMSGSGQSPRTITVNITPTTIGNWQFVSELQQDSTVTYVQDITVGHSDLYGIAPTSPLTPVSVVGVTTRAFLQRSDAGSRGCPVALKSGSTTVLSSPQYLPGTGFGWTYRSDAVDPNTGSAWLSSGVDAVQVGPTITY
jgi:hypothetical protein